MPYNTARKYYEGIQTRKDIYLYIIRYLKEHDYPPSIPEIAAGLSIDPARTPRAYKEIINYEHEVDNNGEVIADYPDGNDHWIDSLRYATSPLSMRRGNSA